MRKASILFKNQEAGVLTQHDDGSFSYRYNSEWIKDTSKPSISLNFPKSEIEFYSVSLFPFFFNMLPEGSNRELVCRSNKIDSDDDLSILLTVAGHDTIGAVRIIMQD